MADLSYEELQRRSRRAYGRDAQGGLRYATGLNKDIQGIGREYGSTDTNGARDELYELGGETFEWSAGQAVPSERQVFSPGSAGEDPQAPVVANGALRFPLALPASGTSSGRRDGWFLTDDTWTDLRFYVELDPGGTAGGLPQQGLFFRWRLMSGSTYHAVTVNSNVLFVPLVNPGVWKHNLDGSGFANRQAAWPSEEWPGFPASYEGTLIGTQVTVKATDLTNGNNWAHSYNLDTEAGTVTDHTTPILAGRCGIIAAHSSADAASMAGVRRVVLTKI